MVLVYWHALTAAVATILSIVLLVAYGVSGDGMYSLLAAVTIPLTVISAFAARYLLRNHDAQNPIRVRSTY